MTDPGKSDRRFFSNPDEEKENIKENNNSKKIFADDWDISPNDTERDTDPFSFRGEFSYVGLFFVICGAGVFLLACYLGYVEFKEWQAKKIIIEFTEEMQKDLKRIELRSQQNALHNQKLRLEREKNWQENLRREKNARAYESDLKRIRELEAQREAVKPVLGNISDYEQFNPNTYTPSPGTVYKDKDGVWRNY